MARLVKRRFGELGRDAGVENPLTPDETLAEAFLTKLGPEPETRSKQSRLSGWLGRSAVRSGSFGVVLLVPLVVLWLAPWSAGEGPSDWKLGKRSEQADRLFGTLLPNYVYTLAVRDQALAEKSGGAEAAVDLREQEREVRATAKAVDFELAERMDSLLAASASPSRSSAGWGPSASRVNQRIRELGLPYYVYANALEYKKGKANQRILCISTYAVEELRWFEQQGSDAGLHVGQENGHSGIRGRWTWAGSCETSLLRIC